VRPPLRLVNFSDFAYSWLNNPTKSRETGRKGDPNRDPRGPLISVTGEREQTLLRYLNRLKEVVVL
jgi:hypothetical protein